MIRPLRVAAMIDVSALPTLPTVAAMALIWWAR